MCMAIQCMNGMRAERERREEKKVTSRPLGKTQGRKTKIELVNRFDNRWQSVRCDQFQFASNLFNRTGEQRRDPRRLLEILSASHFRRVSDVYGRITTLFSFDIKLIRITEKKSGYLFFMPSQVIQSLRADQLLSWTELNGMKRIHFTIKSIERVRVHLDQVKTTTRERAEREKKKTWQTDLLAKCIFSLCYELRIQKVWVGVESEREGDIYIYVCVWAVAYGWRTRLIREFLFFDPRHRSPLCLRLVLTGRTNERVRSSNKKMKSRTPELPPWQISDLPKKEILDVYTECLLSCERKQEEEETWIITSSSWVNRFVDRSDKRNWMSMRAVLWDISDVIMSWQVDTQVSMLNNIDTSLLALTGSHECHPRFISSHTGEVARLFEQQSACEKVNHWLF